MGLSVSWCRASTTSGHADAGGAVAGPTLPAAALATLRARRAHALTKASTCLTWRAATVVGGSASLVDERARSHWATSASNCGICSAT